MVLDDVQLNFGDFLSSKASRASVIFTFFSVSLKKLGWVNPKRNYLCFRKVSILINCFLISYPFNITIKKGIRKIKN